MEFNQEELTNSPWKRQERQWTQKDHRAPRLFLLVAKCHQKFTSDPFAATNLLKNKTQLSKFEYLISFLRWFLNRVASHLAIRRTLWGVVQNGRFMWEEGWGKGAIHKRKERMIFRPGHLLLWGKGIAKASSCGLPLLPRSSGEGPQDRLPHGCWLEDSRLVD